MAKRKLVILTTHFGFNFSGGSFVTCEIFQRLETHFSKVIIICNEVGSNTFKSAEIKVYKNKWHALRILSSIEKRDTVFYGDFYNSFWYVLLRIPFFFTYHDNWPELAQSSLKNRLRALFYVPVYRQIFRKAEQVISVSEFKINYIKKYTNNVRLIRNGFQPGHITNRNKKNDVVMVGTIDFRKYALALKLFTLLGHFNHVIHIFGHTKEHQIARNLRRFPFVNIHGHVENVPYGDYQFLLHTSYMENLPLVFCEALSCGVPILTFDVGGAREIIKNNYNGILVAPYDVNAMKNALNDILEGRIKLSDEPQAMTDYSWEKASEKYRNLMCL